MKRASRRVGGLVPERARGRGSRWSTRRAERPGPLPLVCYAFGAGVTGCPLLLTTATTLVLSPAPIPERRPAGGIGLLVGPWVGATRGGAVLAFVMLFW